MRLRACLFSFTLGLGAFGVGAEPAVTVTLTEARHIAQSALDAGNPKLAKQLAKGLLTANPEDAHALLMSSASDWMLENHEDARKSAAKAYRVAENSDQRLQAAQMAARLSLNEERPTLSQIWLRRASLHADTPEEDEAIARAYGRVRSMNPWSINLAFSVRPSDNVNNGADTAVQIIDGVPVVGFLSRDAQALSGTIISGDVRTEYRLRQTETSRTAVAGRVYVQRVKLSNEAEVLDNSDFDATYGEVSLSHRFVVGEAKKNIVGLRLTHGTYWSDDDTDYHMKRLDADHTWTFEGGHRFTLGGSVAGFSRPGREVQDSDNYVVRGRYSRALNNGDRLGVGLTLQTTDSDAPNRRSDGITARLNYSFGQSWGPAKARFSFSIGESQFDDYRVGFIPVPGGRKDNSATASLSLFFEDYDYAGFAPTVTFNAGRTWSNVSRFYTQEASINFGFQSKF